MTCQLFYMLCSKSKLVWMTPQNDLQSSKNYLGWVVPWAGSVVFRLVINTSCIMILMMNKNIKT